MSSSSMISGVQVTARLHRESRFTPPKTRRVEGSCPRSDKRLIVAFERMIDFYLLHGQLFPEGTGTGDDELPTEPDEQLVVL